VAFSKFAYLKSLHGRKLQPAHFRVLVTMLDYANGDGTKSRRSTRGLADDCVMHIETVKKSIRWLVAHGYVEQTHTGGYGRGASCYTIRPLPPEQGSPQASLSKEAKNDVSPANQGSPTATTPEHDHLDGASLRVESISEGVECPPRGDDLKDGSLALASGLSGVIDLLDDDDDDDTYESPPLDSRRASVPRVFATTTGTDHPCTCDQGHPAGTCPWFPTESHA
jgi:hypothetical protein